MGPQKVPVVRGCRVLSWLNQGKCIRDFFPQGSPGTKKTVCNNEVFVKRGLTVFLFPSFHLYGLECAIAARK